MISKRLQLLLVGAILLTLAGCGSSGPAAISVNLVSSASAGTVRGSILNSTAQAQDTSGALQFIQIAPCRVADTRNATGPFGGPSIVGQSSRGFVIPNSACGIPSQAAAYSLNVTVVPHGGLGYLTAWPSGQSQPLVSTLNSLDGRIKANAAIVPAGTGGAISIYVTDTTDVVLDINGYFVPPDPSALAFYPLTPCRIADTRLPNAPLGGPYLVGGQSRTLPILSSTCQIPSSAQAYSLNFTAVPRGGPLGWLSAWPTGQTWPGVSTLNALTGTVTANAAIVPAGSNGAIDVMSVNGNDTDVVIDINGYFAPAASAPGGLSLYALTPCRVLDTRNTTGSFNGTLLVDVKDSSCGVLPSAQAFALNATVVPAGSSLGFLTLWPNGETQPLVSTLNALDGMITSNMAIVPTANGSINAFSTDATQLVLDINGYFATNPQVSVNQSGALPAGTLATFYSTTLTASNGAPPYSNWTVSSGTLPNGLGLNPGTGVISGTPGAGSGGTSNFSVTVKDSLNVTSAAANLSITINIAPLAITTTSLPNATVGTAYDQPIHTSGGDGTAITFALANSTTLPAWASLNTSTGHITGTPAAGDIGTSAVFQISATQTGTTVASSSLTISVFASGVHNAELNGHYAFLLRGFDPSGQAIAVGGSFTADGAGHITGGVMDINDSGSTPSTDLTINAAPASSYSVGADNRGMLTLNTSAGTQTFDFAVGAISSGVASLGHIISRQHTSATNGSAISGVFKKQDTTAFTLTALNGDWAFLDEGTDSSGGRFASAGRFTLSSGNVTLGTVDFNDNGVFDNNTTNPSTFTGSLGSLDTTNGRVPLTTTVSGGPTGHSAVYIVSASETLFMSIDAISASPLESGSALRQSATFCPTTGGCNFTNAAGNGNAIVYQQGLGSGGAGTSRVELDRLVLTPTGGTTSGSVSVTSDDNDGGSITLNQAQPPGITFTVSANGRVTTAGGGNNPPVLYLVGQNAGFFLESGSSVGAGEFEAQAANPFSISSGGRAGGDEPPAVSGSGIHSGVSTVTSTSSTTGTISSIVNDLNSLANGLHEGQGGVDDTVTIDATTGRLTYGSGTKVGYAIGNGKFVVINIQNTNTKPVISVSNSQ